jgi:WD40 repeat protein
VPFEVWDPVLAFAPDSKSLVTAPGREVLWRDLATGKYRVMTRLQKGIDCLAFTGDGKVLAVGDKEGGVTLWDVTAGKKIGVLWGEVLAAGVGTPRVPSYGLVHLWEVAGWRPRATLRGHTNVVTGVDFSPDGKLLVSGGDETVRLWDPASGKPRATLAPGIGPIDLVKFSPGGRVLAVTGGPGSEHGDNSKPGKVVFYDSVTWRQILTLEAHETSVSSLAFSPVGRLMAVACGRESVKVWDVSALTQGPAQDRR